MASSITWLTGRVQVLTDNKTKNKNKQQQIQFLMSTTTTSASAVEANCRHEMKCEIEVVIFRHRRRRVFAIQVRYFLPWNPFRCIKPHATQPVVVNQV